MKIYEILKEKNKGKTYFDNIIEEYWIVRLYKHSNKDKTLISLETTDGEDIKDNWYLSMQQILEMDFEELK